MVNESNASSYEEEPNSDEWQTSKAEDIPVGVPKVIYDQCVDKFKAAKQRGQKERQRGDKYNKKIAAAAPETAATERGSLWAAAGTPANESRGPGVPMGSQERAGAGA